MKTVIVDTDLGHGARLKITVQPETESIVGSFDFDSAEENAAYLKRFDEDGDLIAMSIDVEISYGPLMGRDHLGMCHFNVYSIETDALRTLAEHDMINTALEDLLPFSEKLNNEKIELYKKTQE